MYWINWSNAPLLSIWNHLNQEPIQRLPRLPYSLVWNPDKQWPAYQTLQIALRLPAGRSFIGGSQKLFPRGSLPCKPVVHMWYITWWSSACQIAYWLRSLNRIHYSRVCLLARVLWIWTATDEFQYWQFLNCISIVKNIPLIVCSQAIFEYDHYIYPICSFRD